MSDLKRALQKITQTEYPLDRALVLGVDKNELTCSVELVSSGAKLSDVLLKPVLNDSDLAKMGLVLFPAIGSYVIIGQVDGDGTDLFVVSCSEIESVGLDMATALKLLISVEGNISLKANKVTFNDGLNGGLPLLKPLSNALAVLQKTVNDLSVAFKTHVHPVVGSATSPTATPSPAEITPILQASDIENKNILQ